LCSCQADTTLPEHLYCTSHWVVFVSSRHNTTGTFVLYISLGCVRVKQTQHYRNICTVHLTGLCSCQADTTLPEHLYCTSHRVVFVSSRHNTTGTFERSRGPQHDIGNVPLQSQHAAHGLTY